MYGRVPQNKDYLSGSQIPSRTGDRGLGPTRTLNGRIVHFLRVRGTLST